MVEVARPNDLAMPGRGRCATSPREISSRSAKLSDRAERWRCRGLMPPVRSNSLRTVPARRGNDLAISQIGSTVRDTYSKGGMSATTTSTSRGFGKAVHLPDERIGLVMVFKAFDRMSYALVMETSHEIREGDLAGNP